MSHLSGQTRQGNTNTAAQSNNVGLPKNSYSNTDALNQAQNAGTTMSKSQARLPAEIDDFFDPNGVISPLCKPILKEQKDRLLDLLTDKKDGQAKKSRSIEENATATYDGRKRSSNRSHYYKTGGVHLGTGPTPSFGGNTM